MVLWSSFGSLGVDGWFDVSKALPRSLVVDTSCWIAPFIHDVCLLCRLWAGVFIHHIGSPAFLGHLIVYQTKSTIMSDRNMFALVWFC